VKGAKLSDMETKIVYLCRECLFYFILLLKLQLEASAAFCSYEDL